MIPAGHCRTDEEAAAEAAAYTALGKSPLHRGPQRTYTYQLRQGMYFILRVEDLPHFTAIEPSK